MATEPTREDKRDRVATYSATWEAEYDEAPDEIDRAILADYAPITPERRAELEERKQVITHLFERADTAVEDNPTDEEFAEERRFFQEWLAELDAELEGTDG